MADRNEVVFLEDARWNAEREAVEVTAVAHVAGGERRIPCAIAREAIENMVRLPSPPEPLRMFRDFEAQFARIVARKLRTNLPEVVVTRRDTTS